MQSRLTSTGPAIVVLCVAVAFVHAPTASAGTGPLDTAANLARDGRCDAALTELDAILKGSPSWGPALYLRADCLERLDRRDEALKGYRRYLGTLGPDAPARAEIEAKMAALERPAAKGDGLADSAAAMAGIRGSGTGGLSGAGLGAGSLEDGDDPLVKVPRPRGLPPMGRKKRFYPATIAGYTMGAIGAAMLFAAALLASASESNEREIEDFAINGSLDPANPGPAFWDASFTRIERSGRLLAALSIALTVTGTAVVGGGFAVGFLALPPKSSKDGHVRAPSVSATVRVRF